MISLKKRNQGFTIVELLIVIVVIGILALLVITTYSGIQQKGRNAQRQSDVKSVQTALEAYYADNSHYPSRTNMNDDSWVGTNMKSLDLQSMVDPSNTDAAAADKNNLGNAAGAGRYAYIPLNSSDASCEADATTCVKYTLVTTFEGTVNGQTSETRKNQDGE